MLKTLIVLVIALVLILGALHYWANQNIKKFVNSCPKIGEMSGNIHFVKKGTGPNLLLLHGASSSLADYVFSGLVDQLSTEFTVYAIDRPGLGFSKFESDEDSYLQNQVDEIVAFMDRQNIDKTILVGHSMGAGIAAAVANQHPQRVSALMSIAGAVYPIGTGASWYTRLVVLPFGIGWFFKSVVMPLVGPSIAEKILISNFSPNPVPENYEEKACMKLLFEPRNFYWNAVALNHFIPYLATQYPTYAQNIKMPVSLIYSEDDKVIYTHIHSGEFKKVVPQAVLHMLPNSGHLPHHYHQDLVIQELMRLRNESQAQ